MQSRGGASRSLSLGEQQCLHFTPAPIGLECFDPRRSCRLLVRRRFGPRHGFCVLGLRAAAGQRRFR